MDNFYTYCRWLGDKTFKENKLNEVDCLIFAFLSYLEFEILMEEERKLPLADLIKLLLTKEGLKVKTLDSKFKQENYNALLKEIAKSKRFRNVKLVNFDDSLDEEEEIQFSVSTFEFDGNKRFVSYRGTDASVVGWKEDFMMSFTKIPAQEMALDYLNNELIEGYEYYVGGHSKGGNLALYSSLYLSDKKQSSIKAIYVFDGPGFCKDVFDKSIDVINDKVYAYLPEYSIVGRLFEPEYKNKKIIYSYDKGPLQHNPVGWRVNKNELFTVDHHDYKSEFLNETISTWLNSVLISDRKKMIDDVFGRISAVGIVSFNDLADKGVLGFDELIISMFSISNTTQEKSGLFFLASLFGDLSLFKKIKDWEYFRNNLIIPALMICFGVLFMFFSENIINSIVAIALLITTILQGRFTFIRLKEANWNIEKEQVRVSIFTFLVSLIIVMLFKENALSFVSNMFFGIGFITIAEKILVSLLKDKKRKLDYYIKILEVFFYAVTGGYLLFTPYHTIAYGLFSLGVVLTLDGLYRGYKSLKE